jgi:hypothetical protein
MASKKQKSTNKKKGPGTGPGGRPLPSKKKGPGTGPGGRPLPSAPKTNVKKKPGKAITSKKLPEKKKGPGTGPMGNMGTARPGSGPRSGPGGRRTPNTFATGSGAMFSRQGLEERARRSGGTIRTQPSPRPMRGAVSQEEMNRMRGVSNRAPIARRRSRPSRRM